MNYRVIKYFTDLQDDEHPYYPGDKFPRDGFTVSASRIKELSGTQNKRGIALIEEVQEAAEKPAAVETEPRKRTRKRKFE